MDLKVIAQEIVNGAKPSIEGLTDTQITELAKEMESIFNEMVKGDKDIKPFIENQLDYADTMQDKVAMVELIRHTCFRNETTRYKFLCTERFIQFSQTHKKDLVLGTTVAEADARFGKPTRP